MVHMICRNRVADFSKWRTIFASHATAHLQAGLRLLHLWRTVDDPNNVFFVFEVAAIDRAQAFINSPDAAKAGQASGVLDGEYHLVEDAGGY